MNGKLCRSCRRKLQTFQKLFVLQSEHTEAANIDYDDSRNDLDFTYAEDLKDSDFLVFSTLKRIKFAM